MIDEQLPVKLLVAENSFIS